MPITDALLLAKDVKLMEVESLPAEIRRKITSLPGDRVVTRPRVRAWSKLVDPVAAALLEEFRSPSTIAEAVLRFSPPRGLDPGETLTEAYPMLRRFLDGRILVSTADEGTAAIAPSFDVGDDLDGFTVVSRVSLLEDTEVYQVQAVDGAFCALKIARPGHAAEMRRTLANEARAYERLDGRVTPRYLGRGEVDGRGYVVTSWCPGSPVEAVAAEARRAGDRRALLALCVAVAGAYAHLHEQGVVHGDVHPGNLLAKADGSVELIDFGYACSARRERGDAPGRAGVAFYFEPECARAILARRPAPAATRHGEQHAVAALLYTLVTGAHYLDFSLEERETMLQIASDAPLPFDAQGAAPWPGLEALLGRALSKSPRRRFASMRRFTARLAALPTPKTGGHASARGAGTPLAEVLASFLQRVSQGGHRYEEGVVEAPRASVCFGAAGIAYALYRVALGREDASLLALADVWMARARRAAADDGAFYDNKLDLIPDKIGRVSVLHTAPGLSCVQALVSLAMGDRAAAGEATRAFDEAARGAGDELDLAFGRSGLLLAASSLLETCPWPGLLARGHDLSAGIWAALRGHGPVGRSLEIPYLGIAHGWAGILYATLRWCSSTGSPPPPGFLVRLEQLAALGEPWGRGLRFRRVLSPDGRLPRDYMASWCNGSAGMIHLWLAAHASLGDARFLDLAERCAWNAWEDAEAHADLCCGFGGRAYGLLALHQATGAVTWRERARELALRAARGIGERCLRRDSLYRGEAGIAVLAAEIDHPTLAAMPFFAGEGWPPRTG